MVCVHIFHLIKGFFSMQSYQNLKVSLQTFPAPNFMLNWYKQFKNFESDTLRVLYLYGYLFSTIDTLLKEHLPSSAP